MLERLLGTLERSDQACERLSDVRRGAGLQALELTDELGKRRGAARVEIPLGIREPVAYPGKPLAGWIGFLRAAGASGNSTDDEQPNQCHTELHVAPARADY